MKKLGKLFSFLMAMALCLSLAPAAFAISYDPDNPGEGHGKITVTNTTKEQNYSVYKLFGATVATVKDADGNESYVYSYQATKQQKDDYENMPDNPFKFSGTDSSEYYNVSVNDGYTFTVNPGTENQETLTGADAVIAFLKAHIKVNDEANTVDFSELSGAAPVGESQPGNNGSITFEGLPFGYYFVYSTLGATVTINSAVPEATVVDKNQEPTFDKTMTENNAKQPGTIPSNDKAIGEPIEYEITSKATNYEGAEQVLSYYIYDTLEAGLSFTDSDVQVYVDKKDESEPVKVTEQATIVWYDENGAKLEGGYDKATARSFSVYIPWATNADVDGDGVTHETIYPANSEIKITYTAELNGKAAVSTAGNKNTANFWTGHKGVKPEGPEPSNDYGKHHDEKQTVTYTYALAILKVDELGNHLPGAKFELYTNDGKKIYAKKGTADITDNGGVNDGIYVYGGTVGDDGTVPEDYTTEFETDEKGQIVLRGVDQGTYKAIETEAPAGYNLYTAEIPVTANTVIEKTTEDYTYDDEWYTLYDGAGNVIASTSSSAEGYTSKSEKFNVKIEAIAFAVVDKQGNLLPSTGGIGTTIFYVVGGALVVAAVVLLVTKKRMNGKD